MKAARVGLVTAGAALFAYAVIRVGPIYVFEEAQALGPGLALILILGGIRLLLQTRAWSRALREEGIRSTTAELIFLRLASQGVGYLTVLGPAASEPIKIRLLQQRGGSATAATLVDTGLYWLSAGLMLTVGCVTTAMLLAHRHGPLIPLATLTASVIAVLYAWVQPKLLLTPVVSSLGSNSPGWLNKAASVEAEIRRFTSAHPVAIKEMFLLDLVCQTLLLAEVAGALWFLHLPVRASAVLSIEAAGRVVRLIGGWMPARVGADEGGAAAAFAALGFPAAGRHRFGPGTPCT